MADADLEAMLASGDADSQEYKDAKAYLTHLALCHTIVSTRNPRKESEINLNASSPDELALLNAAKYYGVRFFERVRDTIILEDMVHIDPDGRSAVNTDSQGRRVPVRPLAFKLLNVIEFTSDRKRMTVIVKSPEDKIYVLTKGADSVIYPLLRGDTSEALKKQTTKHL